MIRSRHIYVLGVAESPVKIGIAANLASRLTSLQIGCPDPLQYHYTVRVPAHLAQKIETACHRHFDEQHRQGEWFNVHKDEAAAEVKRIAQTYCEANEVIARRGGDNLDILAAKYPLDSGAREAVRVYLDRKSTPLGRKDVAKMDAFLVKRCGAATYTLFKKVIAENDSMFELFTELKLGPAAKDRAEASLAKAVNTLAEYAAWCREEALRQRIDAVGKQLYGDKYPEWVRRPKKSKDPEAA